MRISRNWLQTFFEASLPDARVLSDALTFHAFEIESVEGDVLGVKVTPNRGHDCLSHRGIAKEISATLNIPMKNDPLALRFNLNPRAEAVKISIENPKLCARYIAGYIQGVKVGPSPDWLRESLESIGQKSINNIVDAANFAMFNLGQPLHAFDAERLASSQQSTKGTAVCSPSLRSGTNREPVAGSKYKIQVRNAKKGEKITTLDNKEYALSESMLVIADANADVAIGIAGVKGGKTAEVNGATTDIIIESANFDGASVRTTAQALKLRTDASQRFEQAISPEIAAHAMRAAVDLILKLAGGELIGFVDEYPRPQENKNKTVSVSLQKINAVLGTKFTESEVSNAFKRLGLLYKYSEASPRCIFKVEVPFERLDLEIAEDLVEEVGRIVGYEKIISIPLTPSPKMPTLPKEHYYADLVRKA
ncbi:MAG: phenylalanine--tRNA ligase subunit beta, partial [Patescibacteria group bacterium]